MLPPRDDQHLVGAYLFDPAGVEHAQTDGDEQQPKEGESSDCSLHGDTSF
jgi:hypothetical protein